jgi:hypothetical protein
MINRTTSPLRHALFAALLASSTLSAGCYRTVLVAPSELPRLVAAQSTAAPDLEVIDIDGDKRTIHAPIEQITLVPVNLGQRFMQPAGAEWAIPVAPHRRGARVNEGWYRADVTVRRPFAATVDADAVRLSQLPSNGVGPRKIRVPTKFVRAVEVKEPDPVATAGATTGIVLGTIAVTVGVMALIVFGGGISYGN